MPGISTSFAQGTLPAGYFNTAEWMKRQDIRVATEDHIRPSINGQVQDVIVLRVATDGQCRLHLTMI